MDFIEAARVLKATCPGVKICGGVSNLSFAFRGNAACERRCTRRSSTTPSRPGSTWRSSTPHSSPSTRHPEGLLEHVEDIIFNRRPDATDRLVQFAATVTGTASSLGTDLAWRD